MASIGDIDDFDICDDNNLSCDLQEYGNDYDDWQFITVVNCRTVRGGDANSNSKPSPHSTQVSIKLQSKDFISVCSLSGTLLIDH